MLGAHGTELAIVASIRRGLADMEAGRVTPHKEAMRRIRATIARAQRQRAVEDRHHRSAPLRGA